jgi:hypothetical protein
MNGDFWIIKTDAQKANAAAAVSLCPVSADKPYSVQIKPYTEKRRDAQNRLFHLWCGEISKQGGEYTPIEIKARAKNQWGVPILSGEDEMFCALWGTLKERYSYEELLKMLEEAVRVTSLFNVEQMSRFLTDMQRGSSSKFQLTDPSMCGL